MQIDVVTIFPEIFKPILGHSILKRAQAQGRVRIHAENLRTHTVDKRRTVDDRPYGGGPGMIIKPEPIFRAVERLEAKRHPASKRRGRRACRIVLMAPQGERLTQAIAQELTGLEHLVILCGHYEGVDERVRQALVQQELSIGDYVVTGGELPALVLIDCVVRLIPGVLGHEAATVEESFANGLLEYPQYTRPVRFRGMDVPEVLRSGDHGQIAVWRKLTAAARTATCRPDLWQQALGHSATHGSKPPRVRGKTWTGNSK